MPPLPNENRFVFGNNRTDRRVRIIISTDNVRRLAGARDHFRSCHTDSMKTFSRLILLMLCFFESANADPKIAAVQQALKSHVLYLGEVTGEIDNATAAAITRFQARRGLEVTGELNEETLQALGIDAGQPVPATARERSSPKAEPWRALREQDKEFLKELNSAQPPQTDGQALEADSLEQIRDFIAGFVVVGIDENVEAELQFYAPKANYYDSGVVTKDFIRRDIRRYNQKYPTRRYWLVGDIRVLNDPQADPVEVQYRIRYAVKNQQQERTGTAIKTVKLQRTSDGLEITSVREETLN
jgi:peptidoglycan hydrolase-like protein with peptidoglycan-binding domain